MLKAYRGKYERPIYWGDSKAKSWFQQAASIFWGILCMALVGMILVAIIGTICMVIGG